MYFDIYIWLFTCKPADFHENIHRLSIEIHTYWDWTGLDWCTHASPLAPVKWINMSS